MQKKDRIDEILTTWDKSISPQLAKKLTTLDARRGFLSDMLKSTAMLGSLPLMSVLSGCDRPSLQQQLLQQQPWQTFAAVQQQLFPADGKGPAASDINACAYLKFVLDAADTDAEDKRFILEGIKWLNDLSNEKFGKSFVGLPSAQQQLVLKKIATSPAGERWLSHLLLYIMEALLTDPVYGGNPGGIGWQWLEHQPGFPQPVNGKRYTEL